MQSMDQGDAHFSFFLWKGHPTLSFRSQSVGATVLLPPTFTSGAVSVAGLDDRGRLSLCGGCFPVRRLGVDCLPRRRLQPSPLNQLADPTHKLEPMLDETPSFMDAPSRAHCTTVPRNLEHNITPDQRMPCLLQGWTCDAGCDVLWTDDEDETELLWNDYFLTAYCFLPDNKTKRVVDFSS